MEKLTTEFSPDQEIWLNKIRSMEHEMDRLADLNGEIAAKVTDHDRIRQIEHFQNLFIVQKEKLDEMKHKVKVNKINPGIEEYEPYFKTLIHEFQDFSGSVN